MTTITYKPNYATRRALVIGINKYSLRPLEFATNDAIEVAESLTNHFGFLQSDILLLTDEQATRKAIFDAYMTYATISSDDDCLFFFFAGHGHTAKSHRGDVGYLVPVDGNCNTLSSLVRWDDLTRNADLIPAKHVFFVMDACYGGLACTRTAQVGSMRFLSDMYLRRSRQVLTAGKADEVVSDGGGPLPNHSVFTGHFLTALSGKATTSEGLLTANSVMAYVYDHVAKDHQSFQTPHHGHIEGDGDFIFSAPKSIPKADDEKIDTDVLVHVPASFHATSINEQQPLIEVVKTKIADIKDAIVLDDLVTRELRRVHAIFTEEHAEDPPFSLDVLLRRLKLYEETIEQLSIIASLLARWSAPHNRSVLSKLLARLSDTACRQSGLTIWLGLQWYPVTRCTYCAGITALSAADYASVQSIFNTTTRNDTIHGKSQPLVMSEVDGMLEVARANGFQRLPGHDKHYVPMSEYLFKSIQPSLDDAFFLGSSYGPLFDRFEVFRALCYIDLSSQDLDDWGPPGRFAYKYRGHRTSNNPYQEVFEEAKQYGKNWPPLIVGMFRGDLNRFLTIANKFGERLANLGWY